MNSRLVPDSGSFRDPANKVYVVASGSAGSRQRILRGVNAATLETQRRLCLEAVFRNLVADGSVVWTTLLDAQDAEGHGVLREGWAGVLEHQPVPCISYPYEWTWTMLRDAALLQLRILEVSLESGWTLKDATPYNIQWVGSRPVFIDTPSFEPWNGRDPWVGYRQFCMMFLTPLMIRAHLGIDHLPLLRAWIDGIPPVEASKFFSGFNRLRKGVLSHVAFPATVENSIARRERDSAGAHRRTQRDQTTAMVLGLVQSLHRLVRKLSCKIGHTDWSHYDRTHTYSDAEHEAKKQFVHKHAGGRRRSQVLDIGCNTGIFSRLCSEFSSQVISIDGDHDAVEQLYLKQREASTSNILPLVMNLANMSPGQGWAGTERQSFDRRIAPDLILCLALIHHIRLSANIPNVLFLEWLRSHNAEVIIEFVNRDDEMVEKLLTNKREQYEDYNLDQFVCETQRFFSIVDRAPLKNGKREIFFLRPK